MTDVKLGHNWRIKAYTGSIDPDAVPSGVTAATPTHRGPYSEQVAKVLTEAETLFLLKNAEYGNAIEDTGVIGAVVALTGDVGRLRNLVLQSGTTGRHAVQNVRDKLLDVLVQAAIGIMMLDSENFEGKEYE